MVELLRSFPVVYIVTALTGFTELPFMVVLVTAHAVCRESEVGFRHILALQQRANPASYVRRRVAFFASDRSMLAFQGISRPAMIELLYGCVEVNQWEVRAVVLHVAAHAVFAIRIFHFEAGVIALLLGKETRDFLVAIQALEGGRLGAKLMATRATCRAAEGFVGFGKRAGRNLTGGG